MRRYLFPVSALFMLSLASASVVQAADQVCNNKVCWDEFINYCDEHAGTGFVTHCIPGWGGFNCSWNYCIP